MTLAIVFPGQGSQIVGMGKDIHDEFASAREVFEEVEETLSTPLRQLIFEGPQERLNQTEYTQPALMAVSFAIMRVLEKEMGLDLKKQVSVLAGHSLGEHTALGVARALSLADTTRILDIRGRAMRDAVLESPGAMAAILGLSIEAIQEVLDALSTENHCCEIANDNCPGQVVISGHSAAVDQAIEHLTDKGAKKAIKLVVSAPFHCSLMAPAAHTLSQALDQVSYEKPQVGILSNVTASMTQDPARIKANLIQQVTGRVKWRQSLCEMKRLGVTRIVEVGAGKVLSGLTKRTEPDLLSPGVHNLETLDAFGKAL